MRILILSLAFCAFTMLSCTSDKICGTRVEALDDSAWECSQWISVADAPVVEGKVYNSRNNRAADGAACFMFEYELPAKARSAKWMTTGLGVYELYVNGSRVGEEVLKPGYTHYARTKYSFTYDITEAFNLSEGDRNVLFAQVTPGWWGDKIVTPRANEGMRGRKCAFRGVLELTFEDGTRQLYGTDTLNWKAGIAGPVKHAAIYDGEEYDAREESGYMSLEKSGVPEINNEFCGEILPSSGAEVYLLRDMTLKPVESYVWSGVVGASEDEYGKVVITRTYAPGDRITLEPGDTLVVDFGQNAAAVPSFIFKAAEGTVLTCLPGEVLNDGNGARSRGMDGPEGSVHRKNLRAHKTGMRVDYIFGPQKGFVSYCPTRTFFGYRYLSITVTDRTIIKSIGSVPVSSLTSAHQTGWLTTGNDDVNRLISNTLWSQRSNYLSVPTDCPQRNERLGWTADTQVFAETGSFFANTAAFLRKWMRDMRDCQTASGAFPAFAPEGQYDNERMHFGWADAGVIVPWTVWKQFGDTSIISENWDAMERFIAHVAQTRYRFELLVDENNGFQYADWLSYEPLESWSKAAYVPGIEPRRPLPEALDYWNFLGACYWAIDAGMMRDMASATGKDASVYENMREEARSYIRDRFMTSEGMFKTQLLNTMQTPALFALKAGVVEGDARSAMVTRLRQNFEYHGNCLQTGFLGTSILMPVLSENGMNDIAYELLFQRRNPSWMYSIDNGATTIWERWNSYTLDCGIAKGGMTSFNHYAYGCVCEWLWETVAGISCDASDPGFKTIIMKPVPDRRLGWVEAEYQSSAGLIKSSWKYHGNAWVWHISIPEGASALVTLPGETDAVRYEAGDYEFRR